MQIRCSQPDASASKGPKKRRSTPAELVSAPGVERDACIGQLTQLLEQCPCIGVRGVDLERLFDEAHGFGSRQPLRDGGLALVFALAAYFGFAKALGVNIGAGVIEKLLGA